MKILHLTPGNLYGGIETMLVTMARCRDLCPVLQPQFAACFAGRFTQEVHAAKAPVHLLGNVQVRKPWQIWAARRKLAVLLSQEKFEAVFCHGVWTLAVFGPAIKRAQTALAVWLHDVVRGRSWLDRWARTTRPDFAVCNSHFTARLFANLFADLPPAVIYCPVGLSEPPSDSQRQSVRKGEGVAPEAIVIIQVGRMAPLKGHRHLLAALAHLIAVPGWICWIVGGPQRAGETEYFENLESNARELGLERRVRFLGQRNDVPQLLAAADICCQPNAAPETFGISLVEALAAGLPVVGTALGGALEIVEPHTGFLVPVDDAGELSEKLKWLIENQKLRAELSSRGPSRARELCDPATRLEQLRQLLQTRASGPVLHAALS